MRLCCASENILQKTNTETSRSTLGAANYTGFYEALSLTGCLFAGKFDSLGLADGSVPRALGPVKVLRLTVHSETDNWAILSEVSRFVFIDYKIFLLRESANKRLIFAF